MRRGSIFPTILKYTYASSSINGLSRRPGDRRGAQRTGGVKGVRVMLNGFLKMIMY